MNDLPTLRDAKNNSMVRLLSNRVSAMCSGSGHIGQTAETLAGRPPVPADATKEADAPGNSGRDQEPILSMSMFASKADYDVAMLRLQGPIA